MKKSKEAELLREYVRSVLKEDDGGAIGYSDLAMMSGPGGAGHGMESQFWSLFTTSFGDVLKTAAAEFKKLGVRAMTAVKVGVESVKTTVLPWLMPRFDKIFQEQKSKIDSINQEYADVYKRTQDALGTNTIGALSLIMFPEGYITKKFIEKAPRAAYETLNAALGGELKSAVGKLTGGGESKKESLGRRGRLLNEDSTSELSDEQLRDMLLKNYDKLMSKAKESKAKKEIESVYRSALDQIKKIVEGSNELVAKKVEEALKNPDDKMKAALAGAKSDKERQSITKSFQAMSIAGIKKETKKIIEAKGSELFAQLPKGHPLRQEFDKILQSLGG
jgi:hypothetical protein